MTAEQVSLSLPISKRKAICSQSTVKRLHIIISFELKSRKTDMLSSLPLSAQATLLLLLLLFLPPWHSSLTVGIKSVSFTGILCCFLEAFFMPDPDEENMAIWSDSLLDITNLRWHTNKKARARHAHTHTHTQMLRYSSNNHMKHTVSLLIPQDYGWEIWTDSSVRLRYTI